MRQLQEVNGVNVTKNTLFDEVDTGYYILSRLNLDMDNDKEVGRLFLSKYNDKHQTYKQLKINFDAYIKDILSIIDGDIISNKITKYSKGAVLNYRIFRVYNTIPETNMYINDFSADYKEFIAIDFVDSYSYGAGREIITEFLHNVRGIPVILTAGVTSRGLYEYGSKDELDNQLYSLKHYYEGLGFKDMNDEYGCYDENITMVNLNGVNL